MRLLKLSLENWRGVDVRKVQFVSGVTVVEGPNEVGKSTIVEALRMLFKEMDSSNKKNVKAIQPVGQDVGSRVEVEVQAGNYHFVYAKTYNKSRQTTLDILAPTKRQLTGREAHETVEQMLAESVDMILWDALLVDQGEKVAPANLQASGSLAQALDEAAGSVSAGTEDTDLFSAVRAEYEKYFTVKTARPKFAALEQHCVSANATLAQAKIALDAVEEDSIAYERSAVEVRRLKTLLPDLRKKVEEHDKTWKVVGSLQEKVTTKRNELAAAQQIRQAVLDTHTRRIELVAEIASKQQQLGAETNAQVPLRTQSDLLMGQITSTAQAIAELKQQLKDALRALDFAEGDDRYTQDLETITREAARLERLEQLSESMRSHVAIAAAISVDDAAVESFREADNRLAIALGTRDAAATTVSVTARRGLTIEFDDVSVALDDGALETRTIAAALALRIPGVADIRIVPSQSVSELQERTQDAKDALAMLARRHGVQSLEAAVVANQRRADAKREVDRLKGSEEHVLQHSNREEILAAVTTLQAQCDQYFLQRGAGANMPGNAAESQSRVNAARSLVASAQRALDDAREQAQALQSKHNEHDSDLRLAQQKLAVLQAGLKDKCERLAKERTLSPDDALADQAASAAAKVEALDNEAGILQASLNRASPEAALALLTNAKDVCERAAKDLQKSEQELAVLHDRLQHAQADGRFEAFEIAKRNLEASNAALESTRRRSASAALLWTTLSKHRDASRLAYVRPLKEAIERLGAIVFGSGFEVSVGDDWSLKSRTLHGKTLPFDDLSVGAKEQLGILARLAAAQIVSRQGGVPLIIDDALGFADPSRLATMGAAIAAAGKNCQIIILTCTPGRFTHVGSAEVVRF